MKFSEMLRLQKSRHCDNLRPAVGMGGIPLCCQWEITWEGGTRTQSSNREMHTKKNGFGLSPSEDSCWVVSEAPNFVLLQIYRPINDALQALQLIQIFSSYDDDGQRC